MANQGYLTYDAPSISELFGGMKPPSWLSEGVQYKPFEYQLAVADQMDKMAKAQAERDRQDREAQAELERKDKARAQIQGDLQGLDLSQADPREILTKVQQGLFDAGLIDQGISATRGLLGKQEQPKVQRIGDALVQIDPDGNVREIYKNEKPAKSERSGKAKIFTDGQGDYRQVYSPEEEIQARKGGYFPVKNSSPGGGTDSDIERLKAIQNKQAQTIDTPPPGVMENIGAWLQGLYNQPTVNPRSTNSPAVDQGSLVTGDGTRRVFTVRRKAIEQ